MISNLILALFGLGVVYLMFSIQKTHINKQISSEIDSFLNNGEKLYDGNIEFQNKKYNVVNLLINEQLIEFKFPLTSTAKDIASKYCSSLSDLSSYLINECISNIESALIIKIDNKNIIIGETLNDIVDSKLVKLEINSITYVFEYPTSMDVDIAASYLAREFCIQKGEVLNIKGFKKINDSSDEEEIENMKLLEEKCIFPLTSSLDNEIRSGEL
jgi:hypothetical protein